MKSCAGRSLPRLAPTGLAALVVSLSLAAPTPSQEGAGGREGRSQGVLQRSEVAQEEGEPGTRHPEAGDVVMDDTRVHDDTRGRAQHTLLELVSWEGAGFAAAWRDTRQGYLGLYFARLDPRGERLEPEHPFPYSGAAFRLLEPSIAIGPRGAGVVAWLTAGHPEDWAFNARRFGPDGAMPEHESLMGLGRERLRQLGPGGGAGRGRGSESPVPAAGVRPDGTGIFAWAQRGAVFLQPLEPGPSTGRVEPLDLKDPPATGKPLLGSAPQGNLCVWSELAGADSPEIRFHLTPPRGSGIDGSAGLGKPLQIVPAPAGSPHEGEWWIAVDRGADLALRRLSRSGKPVGEDVHLLDAPWGNAVLAAWSEGLALLVQDDARFQRETFTGGRPTVRFLDHDGAPSERGSLSVLGPQASRASGARVAGAGDVLVVAWSELRGSDVDVYWRTLERDAQDFGVERRLNTDEVSGLQKLADVAGAGGATGLVAWTDGRDGDSRLYARLVSAKGGFLTPEMALPATAGADPGSAPASDRMEAAFASAAMAEDGSFALAWLENPGAWTLRMQIFDPGGRALGAAFDADPGARASPQAGLDLEALPHPGGWAIVWSRADGGLAARRISQAGEPGELRQVAARGTLGNVDLTGLDDGRLIAAWDVRVGEVYRLRARFLDAALEPVSGELDFETMWRGSDWDPSVAPTSKGGFAMAWCSGEDASRDLYARFFDRDGRPAGKPHAITARLHEQDFPSLIRSGDGSWLVAWEDDISYLDHTYVRRLPGGSKEPGPVRLIERREEVYHENYQAPRLAPLEGGFLAAWSDCRRGQGFDVFVKVLGLGFDKAQRR